MHILVAPLIKPHQNDKDKRRVTSRGYLRSYLMRRVFYKCESPPTQVI